MVSEAIPCTRRTGPERGRFFLSSLGTEPSGVCFRTGDVVAFEQMSTPLFRVTFGAFARYLPVLSLIFFE